MLRLALEPVEDRFDYVLIDCPPSLGLLTVNALLAARDGVLIPVQCEYLALEGLTQLLATLGRVRAHLFPELKIRGLVLTMFDSRTHLSRDVVEEVRRHFPGQVFRSIIPRTVRLAEAPSHGLPISVYDRSSVGAAAYKALADEVLRGDGVRHRPVRPSGGE
jgi:chromosome partitioning protein